MNVNQKHEDRQTDIVIQTETYRKTDRQTLIKDRLNTKKRENREKKIQQIEETS